MLSNDSLAAIMGEPKPLEFPDEWITTFSAYMGGSPIFSEGGNWYVAHLYEHDDIQEWMPVQFDQSISDALRLAMYFGVSLTPRTDGMWRADMFTKSAIHKNVCVAIILVIESNMLTN